MQVCTGVMLNGMGIVKEMKTGLSDFMEKKGFERLQDMVGVSVKNISTHADLVERQKAAKIARAGQSGRDEEWGKAEIEKQTEEHTAN